MIYVRFNYIKPNYIIFIFDNNNNNNYRKNIFKLYKSNRKKPSKNFLLYIKLIKEKLKLLNIKIICIKNIETDDIIYNIIKKLNNYYKYILIYILSYDKDFIQLINDKIFLYTYINKIWNINNIYKKYGVYPYLIKDLFVLLGDRSDNIPGIRGIGIKTGVKIINIVGDIYNLYNKLNILLLNGININIINNIKNNFYNIRIWYRLLSFSNKIKLSFKINNYIVNKNIFNILK